MSLNKDRRKATNSKRCELSKLQAGKLAQCSRLGSQIQVPRQPVRLVTLQSVMEN